MMLSLDNISLKLGARTLIQPFSLAIEPGSIVTLMGASGSGKSSLLSFIGGELAEAFVATGDITLNRIKLNHIAPEKRKIARLFQDDLLFPHMTVGENILFAIPQAPAQMRQQKMREALQLVELDGFEARAPHTLSGGQRARVALVRSLVAQPLAILLDEPFSKLDPALRAAIRAMTFNLIREQKIPALLVTHSHSDAPTDGVVLQISTDGKLLHV